MSNKPNVAFHDDVRLVNRLIAGDERAFDVFFHDNFDRVFRFALIRLSDDAVAAEDVTQESLRIALIRIRKYRGDTSLFAWLCSICDSQVAVWLRDNVSAPDPVVLIEDSPEFQLLVDTFSRTSIDDVFEISHCANTRRSIHVALDRLPVNYASILEWRYVEGRSVNQISDDIGISAEEARSTLWRAIHAFTEVYGPFARAAQVMRATA